jgi:ribA/ribD-fused uncharacterized protein
LGYFLESPCYPITIDDLTWPASEHYFLAQKFVEASCEAARIEAIRSEPSPRGAFTIGRDPGNPHQPDWELARDSIMRRAVLANFGQRPDLRDILLSTGDATLVEHPENDRYWDATGKIRLGKILMEVRRELRGTS